MDEENIRHNNTEGGRKKYEKCENNRDELQRLSNQQTLQEYQKNRKYSL